MEVAPERGFWEEEEASTIIEADHWIWEVGQTLCFLLWSEFYWLTGYWLFSLIYMNIPKATLFSQEHQVKMHFNQGPQIPKLENGLFEVENVSTAVCD